MPDACMCASASWSNRYVSATSSGRISSHVKVPSGDAHCRGSVRRPRESLVESSPSRQRRPPCETNKGMSDEDAEAAALTYLLLTYCFRSPAPALVVPCSPMPVVTSVNQMVTYQVCRHPASLCLVDHVLHGICPNVMTLESQRITVAS